MYESASTERQRKTFPGHDSVGPLMTVSLLGGQDRYRLRHAAKGDTQIKPHHTYGLRCRSMKQLLRVERWLKRRFPGRVVTEEEMKDQWDRDVEHVRSPAFDEEMRSKMYIQENMQYHRCMATHQYNLFQSCSLIRKEIFRPDSMIPFSIAAHVAGSLGLRLWAEDYLIRGSFSNSVPLHCFFPFVGVVNTRGDLETRGITMWVFLDDVTIHDGAVGSIPCSHDVMHRALPSLDELNVAVSHPVSFDFGLWKTKYPALNQCPAMEIVQPKAGDILLMNHATVHGMLANMTRRQWSAVLYHMIPEGSVFAGVRNSWISRELLQHVEKNTLISDLNHFPICTEIL